MATNYFGDVVFDNSDPKKSAPSTTKNSKNNYFSDVVFSPTPTEQTTPAVPVATPISAVPKEITSKNETLSAPKPIYPVKTGHPLEDLVTNASHGAFSTVKDIINGAVTGIGNFLDTIGPPEKNKNGNDYTQDTPKTIGMTPEQRKAYYDAQVKIHSPLNKGVKAAEAGLSVLNFIPEWAAFSTVLGADRALPGPLGLPAKGIDTVFNGISKIGGDAFGKVIDTLPLNPATKDAIRPVTQDIGGFVAQIAALEFGLKGLGKGYDAVKEKVTKTQEQQVSDLYAAAGAKMAEKVHQSVADGVPVTPEVAKQMIEDVKSELPAEAKKIRENKNYVYEPYTPEGQLPTIDFGPEYKPPKDTSGLPTIQIGEPKPRNVNVPGDFTYEPITHPDTLQALIDQAQSTPLHETIPQTVPKPAQTLAERYPEPVESVKPVKKMKEPNKKIEMNTEDIPEGKVTKVSSDISKDLVKQGFEALSPDEQSRFDPVTKKDQMEKVSKILSTDLEKAKRMALGDEPIPNDIKSQVLFNAVKEYARKNKDVQLQIDLAKSPITIERSLHAQELGSSGFNNGEYDPVEIIHRINKDLQGQVKGDVVKLKKESVKQIKEKIEERKPKRQDWESFIESIQC